MRRHINRMSWENCLLATSVMCIHGISHVCWRSIPAASGPSRSATDWSIVLPPLQCTYLLNLYSVLQKIWMLWKYAAHQTRILPPSSFAWSLTLCCRVVVCATKSIWQHLLAKSTVPSEFTFVYCSKWIHVRTSRARILIKSQQLEFVFFFQTTENFQR